METIFTTLIALVFMAALLLAAFVGFWLLQCKDEEMKMKRRKEADEAMERLRRVK